MTVYLLLILPVFLCTYLFVIVFVSLSNTIVYICTKASFCDNSVFLCTTFTMVMILYRNFITNLLVICLKINHNEQLTSQGFFFIPSWSYFVEVPCSVFWHSNTPVVSQKNLLLIFIVNENLSFCLFSWNILWDSYM